MKNKILLFVVLLFSWMSEGVAAIVPADVAAEMAKVLLTHRGGGEFKGGKSYVETVSRDNKPVYYIVRFEHGGWAMIAAEDTVDPLLGYSLESEMVSVDQMPEVMKDWFSGYADEIEFARQLPALKRHARWDSDIVTRAAADIVAPLIKINWNQGDPYNKYCPGPSNSKAVVGCVAVGMGQALSVVQFPLRGKGTKSYTSKNYGELTVNFDNEPDYDWAAIMSGANNKDEVARLLYHCGVLVDMDYSATASGTQTDFVDEGFRDYYGFPETCVSLNRSDYKDDVWIEMMVAELKRGRAIIYGGQNNESGHCFNLDGYDGNKFHVNWGWGGMSNGYFALDALNPESQGIGGSASGYNIRQRAVIGVAPKSDTPYDMVLSTTRLIAGTLAGTPVAEVIVYSDNANAEYNFELKGTMQSFPPGTTNRNPPAYEVKLDVSDGKYKLYATTTLDKNKPEHKGVLIKAIHTTSGESIEKEFSFNIIDGGNSIDDVWAEELKVYPVPATDVLHIEAPEAGEYTIFNVAGVAVLQGKLDGLVSTLDISMLSSGSYMLRYSTAQGVAVKTFIVK